VLHILLHMAQHDGPLTSEHMAKAMETNPVVVRRIMGGLREHGFVVSEKGHGGGWSLSCKLSEVTLRHIYDALGCPPLLAIGNRTEAPGCAVEEAVNDTLGSSFRDAEALLLARLGDVTLEALSANVRARVAARGRGKQRTRRAHA
jgi:DNA-binding IscR family transcriptional regulator